MAKKGAEHQQRLQEYKEKVSTLIEQGISPFTKYQEKRKKEKRHRQKEQEAGFLSSKNGRRSVLLASTALGLVFIFSAFGQDSITLFVLGNSIIIAGGMCVWRGRAQGITIWRKSVLNYGGVLGIIIWALGVVVALMFAVGLIIYLTSIYIGRW